jgi:hypothetical protein
VRRAGCLALTPVVAALACGGDAADPCDGATGACLALRVDSDAADEIDQLELDVVYGDRHATTSTQADGGRAVPLPVVTAIDVDVAGLEVDAGGSLAVGVVAAGKLGGLLVGTGAGSAAVSDGSRADIDITLAPVQECTPGGHYCGGDQLAGDPDTLYTCVEDSVPQARGVCTAGCRVQAADDDVCRADGGTCVEGGFYCGGDKLAGDPATLYTCAGGVGVSGTPCPDGCLVRPGQDDICR